MGIMGDTTNELLEEKAKLVGMYNALQDKIDEYGLEEIAIESGPFKKLCATKQRIEQRLKEINQNLELLSDNK